MTCSSCTCAPLFAVHCPFPVSSLRASVHSQQCFFPCPPTPPPFFCLEPLFSSFNYSLCSLYIARPERISSRSLFYCSTSIYVSSNHLYYGIILGLIPPLGSWDVKLLSWFPIKAVAVKCNPWLHFTLQ